MLESTRQKPVLIRPAPVTGLNGSRSLCAARVRPSGHGRKKPRSRYACPRRSRRSPATVSLWEPGRSDKAFTPTPLQRAPVATLQRSKGARFAAMFPPKGTDTSFPNLKVVSVENSGADWVGHLLRSNSSLRQRAYATRTSRNIRLGCSGATCTYVNPFWEGRRPRISSTSSPSRARALRFRLPAPEGLAEPLDYLDYLAASTRASTTGRRVGS